MDGNEFNDSVDSFIKKEQEETKIQSVLFNCPPYDEERAVAWLKKKKYKVTKPKQVVNYLVFEQANLDDFARHTLKQTTIEDNVELIIGKLKPEHLRR